MQVPYLINLGKIEFEFVKCILLTEDQIECLASMNKGINFSTLLKEKCIHKVFKYEILQVNPLT